MPDLNAVCEAVRPVIQQNVTQAIQDSGHKFTGMYEVGSYTGDRTEMIDEIGQVNYQERRGKNQDTPNMDAKHRKRWIEPTLTPEYGHLFDENYDLTQLEDPENAHVTAVESAMRRAKDDCFVDAFFGKALVGQKGRDLQAFNDKMIIKDDYILTGTNTGLTPEKLILARAVFGHLDVDLAYEKLYFAAPSHIYGNYLGHEKVANIDFNSKRVFETGTLDGHIGVNFVEFGRLPEVEIDGKIYIECPLWCASGMHLGTWKEPKIKLGESVGKKFDTQLYTYGKYGATRTEEKKVIKFLIEKPASMVDLNDFSF